MESVREMSQGVRDPKLRSVMCSRIQGKMDGPRDSSQARSRYYYYAGVLELTSRARRLADDKRKETSDVSGGERKPVDESSSSQD